MKLVSFLLLSLVASASALAKEAPRRASVHAAIAYHAATGSVGWATDRKTVREAKIEALRQCGHARCEVVAEVSGGCAALARSARKHAVQKGVTREEAEAKALRKCGAECQVAAWTCTR